MFKFFQTWLLISAIQKVKTHLLIILFCLIAVGVFNAMINDFLAIKNDQVYLILAIKWMVNLSVFAVIIFQTFKVIKYDFNPLSSHPTQNEKTKLNEEEEKKNVKQKILKKERLKSRTELVLEKYKK